MGCGLKLVYEMICSKTFPFLFLSLVVLAPFMAFSCGKTDGVRRGTAYVVELDDDIARMIIQDDGGVTGGDGMYSVPLPDGRSVFLMGDSYTGKVTGNTRSTSDHMFRNSYQIYDNGRVSAVTTDATHSAAVPPGHPDEDKWYWPGDGFARDGVLYVFQLLMYQGAPGAWGFRYEETHLLEYSLPDLKLLRDSKTPYSGDASVIFGAAALDDGEWIYVYAQADGEGGDPFNPVSNAYCARTTAGDIHDRWEYFTGSGWSEDFSRAEIMSGLSDVPVSSQFNVFRLRDKYVLLTQHKFLGDGSIFTFTSDTPYGPWTNKRQIFKVPDLGDKDWFAYNAMAHPQFEKDGMILFSFNVNTNVFSQQFSDVRSYRPRFFWYPVDGIVD